MIIGLTGTIAAGKSTVADILKRKGFEHYTYSDILRKEARKRGLQESRENLQRLGNEFKSKDPGILSSMIIKEARGKDIIADGIRTVDEITELKKHIHAYVLALDAPPKIRYERLKRRDRPGDPLTFEQFLKIDEHENKGLTPGQEIERCIQNADFTIINDSTDAELEAKLDEVLEKISQA